MVYLFYNTESDLYKIGFTRQGIKTRLRQIRRTFPKIKFIHCLPGGWHEEQAIMSCFQCRRVTGEWFKLSSDDVDLIVSGEINQLFQQL